MHLYKPIDNDPIESPEVFQPEKKVYPVQYKTCHVVYKGYRGHINITKITRTYVEGTTCLYIDTIFAHGTTLRVPFNSIHYFGSTSANKTDEIIKRIKEMYPERAYKEDRQPILHLSKMNIGDTFIYSEEVTHQNQKNASNNCRRYERQNPDKKFKNKTTEEGIVITRIK